MIFFSLKKIEKRPYPDRIKRPEKIEDSDYHLHHV